MTVCILAVALAMDAFAVSITTGVQLRTVSTAQTLRMGGAFGGFQFLMPVIGWGLGFKAQHYIEAYDHWLAFALLAFVGGKMIREALSGGGDTADTCAMPEPKSDPTRGGALVLLGVATSLDALAVGLSFALLQVDVWMPALVIGAVCFGFTALGLHLGRLVCTVPGLDNLGGKANILGGTVLLGIGLKILHEHGVFS